MSFDISKYTYKVDDKAVAKLVSEDVEIAEEQRKEIAVLFESAVNAKLTEIGEKISEDFDATLQEQQENFEQELLGHVNMYLEEIVNKWVEKNRVQIEEGIKGRLNENLIKGIAALFESHYIDIPENRIDVVKELSEEVDSVESEKARLIDENAKLQKEINEMKCKAIFEDVAKELTESEKEDFAQMTAHLDKDDPEVYQESLGIIFKGFTKKSVTTEGKDEAGESGILNESKDEPYLSKIIEQAISI